MIQLQLRHDTKKELKGGKRRYVDDDGHNIYLSGEEVEKIGASDEVEVTIKPRS